jgi:hypothetical protein
MTMRNTSVILILLVSLFTGTPVFSQTATDALSNCLVDNLSGKERKNLARWVFFSMGTHPEIKLYLNASKDDVEKANEYVGKLITRLLVVDCSDRLKAAYASDPTSVQTAFKAVGGIAMQELMIDANVQKSLTGYMQFTDRAAIENLITGNR